MCPNVELMAGDARMSELLNMQRTESDVEARKKQIYDLQLHIAEQMYSVRWVNGPVTNIARHILPNAMPPILVIATAQLGIAILIEASVSFLGYGIQPPAASWGFMLGAEARIHMIEQPWLSVWPGLAIFLTMFSFNIIGDALRDAFDPRLRGA